MLVLLYFYFAILFAVKTLYKRQGVGAGCADKGLTLKECREAIYILGYNTMITNVSNPDIQKGCVVKEVLPGFFTESYFNLVNGRPDVNYRSICLAGI